MTAWRRWEASERTSSDWERWLAVYRACNHEYRERTYRDEETGKRVKWRPHGRCINVRCRRCGHGKVVLLPRRRRR